jgi:C4-dicarboxylate-specific signal transduction histidine kinase
MERIVAQDRAVVDEALRQALADQDEFDVEYRVGQLDDEFRWQSARGGVDPSRPTRLVGVAIDITQRKQAEAQVEIDRAALYHMSRVSLLGQLSASIAHQLNQPLASILANAETAQKMLEREPVDLAELRLICDDIVADDLRADQVIRRLTALFRRGPSKFESLDLNELVRDSLDLIRGALTTRSATLVTNLSHEPLLMSGDRVQLQQLLLNLVVNAADAMAQLTDRSHDVTITTIVRDGNVELCVTDRGAGVAAEVRDKLFEPFWTTREGGMGMGLTICRSIAVAHSGSLAVSNVPDGGARFCASFPLLGGRG